MVAGADGIKTGYTRASGFNLMTSAKRDGRRVIAIMLGGNTSRSRNSHVEDLVEAAFTTLNDPAHDTQLAFAGVLTPIHPNDAAEPMLNGKRISVIIAEGGSDDASDPAEETPVQEIAAHAKLETPVEPVEQPETRVMSVAEYEARQMGLIK